MGMLKNRLNPLLVTHNPVPRQPQEQQVTRQWSQRRTSKKRIYRSTYILLIIFFLFSCGPGTSPFKIQKNTPGSTPPHTMGKAPVPLPDTTENIHLGMVGDDQQSLQKEKGLIDYVWGSDSPGNPPALHKSFYFKFDRAGGYPGDTSFPVYYDQDWFLAHHPDWLVYLCDKKTLAYEFQDPNVPLDITNPAVLQFMLDTWIYPALNHGYDGIAFDNVNLTNTLSDGRCGIWKTDSHGNKQWTYIYGDENSIKGPGYINSIINWAKFMYHAIHTYTPGATMEVNFSPDNGGIPSEPPSFNKQLLPYIDLDFNEDGYTYGVDGFTTDANWRQEVDFSCDLAARRKGQLLTFGFSFSDLTQQQKQWTIANYLLVKGTHTYVYIARPTDSGEDYGYLNVIPEYSAKVGHAINSMYRSQGVYMRDYSNGKTIVNPSSALAVSITLPPHRYKDLYGNTINTLLTLNPHSGIVLLTQ